MHWVQIRRCRTTLLAMYSEASATGKGQNSRQSAQIARSAGTLDFLAARLIISFCCIRLVLSNYGCHFTGILTPSVSVQFRTCIVQILSHWLSQRLPYAERSRDRRSYFRSTDAWIIICLPCVLTLFCNPSCPSVCFPIVLPCCYQAELVMLCSIC